MRESARNHPEKPAVVCGEHIVSYLELNRATDALAWWLRSQGLRTSDRVAIHWANSVETVMLFYACFKAGLIAVPVNNRLKSPEIAYILGHSKARLCFSQPELAPLAERVLDECPRLEKLYTELPDLAGLNPGPSLAEVPLQEVAAVLYTSGTTARPKGVMHTHISLTGSTQLMITLGIDETHTVLAVTQMMHIAALGCVVLPGIACGATVVLMPAFDAGPALEAIERWKCTYMLTLPAMLRFMVEEQGHRPRDVSSMRLCLAGGDTVPAALQHAFRARFPIPVREMYGMTETVPVTANRPDAPRIGSMGQALDLVETRVANAEGVELGAGELGELQVSSPANCIGYWDDFLATDAAFVDGWLRTGDLTRRDADGYFWFEGRAKQIIVRGGSNISPQEVEEALYHHPAVLETGVIGMPDPVHGEKVVAFVALREGMSATEPELRELCRSRIADYKVPEHIVFLPALPKGLTGKVQRRELRQFAPEF
ncbi:MAG: AMP-binding protein [Terracidiphilus sp.]